jgi:uncharacterized protein YkwD
MKRKLSIFLCLTLFSVVLTGCKTTDNRDSEDISVKSKVETPVTIEELTLNTKITEDENGVRMIATIINNSSKAIKSYQAEMLFKDTNENEKLSNNSILLAGETSPTFEANAPKSKNKDDVEFLKISYEVVNEDNSSTYVEYDSDLKTYSVHKDDEKPVDSNVAEVPTDENSTTLNNNPTTENNTQPAASTEKNTQAVESTEKNTQQPNKVIPKPDESTKEQNNSVPKSNPNGATDVQGDYLARVEDEIFTATNNERTKTGLKPLKRNSTANSYSRSKSLEMLNLNYFDHKSPNNGSIFDISNRDGWRYSRMGENIYTMTGGSASSSSGTAITTAWMNSEGHKANILNGGYTDIGIGVTCRNNKLYATQIFYTP